MGIQEFGEKFDLNKLLHARDVTRDIARELSHKLHPGMTEEDAHALFKEILRKRGIEKQWHPAKLRLGPNTIKSFRDPSVPHTLLSEDIFFLDIGPIIDGHEADYGETFVIGSRPEHRKIAEDAQVVFKKVKDHWKQKNVTGIPLYEFARAEATSLGYELSTESADGHRIGDFPHHIHFKGGLIECEEEIIPNAWILEIHLLSPDKKFGAFFEDILS